MKFDLHWKHRRERLKAERKETEPRAGTHWWFVAGTVGGAGTG